MDRRRAENITNRRAIDGKPAWVGNTIYFLSDQAEDMRINLWAYDVNTRQERQLTRFPEFDISYMSAGDDALVFEVGGVLYLMDVATEQYKPVNVEVVSDLSVEMPRSISVGERINNASPSPDGKRVIFEARGELFNVPVADGYTINLTRSSGAFDQFPAWSPDGKHVACWSDRSGENEVWLHDSEGLTAPRQLTSLGKGMGYTLHWSPDSKYLAYIDHMNDIWVLEVESGELTLAANTRWNISHGGKAGWSIS